MTVSVRDARGTARDREWIESVYRDYLDDLSPLNTGVFSATSLGEIGYSESDQLARWFGDSSVNALVILRGTEPVGFAMVARGSATPGKSAGRLPHGRILRRAHVPPPRRGPPRRGAHPQSFCRALGNHRVPAQSGRGRRSGAAWSLTTPRAVSRSVFQWRSPTGFRIGHLACPEAGLICALRAHSLSRQSLTHDHGRIGMPARAPADRWCPRAPKSSPRTAWPPPAIRS